MDITNKCCQEPLFLPQIPDKYKSFGFLWLAILIQNFAPSHRRFLRFICATTALGCSVWMVVRALRNVEWSKDEEDVEIEVAPGLQTADRKTLNRLINRSPLKGFSVNQLVGGNLERIYLELRIFAGDLSDLKKGPDYVRDTYFLLHHKDHVSLTIPQPYGTLNEMGYDVTQHQHLLFGYCTIRSDLFKCLKVKNNTKRLACGVESYKLNLYFVDSAKEVGDGYVVPSPLGEEVQAVGDVDHLGLLNRLLKLGGGEELQALPEEKKEGIKEVCEAISKFNKYLDRPNLSNKMEVNGVSMTLTPISEGLQLAFDNDLSELDEEGGLSQEQIKLIFLGLIAEHKNYVGPELLEDGTYRLWEKDQVVEVKNRQQFLDNASTKKEFDRIQNELATEKDIRIVFDNIISINQKNYLKFKSQLISFPKESVKTIFSGFLLSGDLPGIKEVQEIQEGTEYKLIKGQKV